MTKTAAGEVFAALRLKTVGFGHTDDDVTRDVSRRQPGGVAGLPTIGCSGIHIHCCEAFWRDADPVVPVS